MALHDFASQRLFLDSPLAGGLDVRLSAEQANYLVNVLRMKSGAPLLVFNGRDGEWQARISEIAKRSASLTVEMQVRAQPDGPDIDYLFAPLKHARLDYLVQKATEMGVKRLRPVFTRRTVADRINGERMRANVIEAAEQCGVLRVPEVAEPEKLSGVLSAWEGARPLIFCDEDAGHANPIEILRHVAPGPLAVLVGPEGGFDPQERAQLMQQPYVVRVSLGPRIMRADTAAIAILALVNAVLGDWT